jgi:multicomponent Na+:H+ antiporter subunit A
MNPPNKLNPPTIYGAQKSLIITVFGGLSLLGGFILISLAGDSLSLISTIAKINNGLC